ncbi:MAG: DUF4249 domain-containing protein [Cytophagaceae bacterium]|jgi:hypothetical protein|nr:DUF4249 domain-containing protein [Cytophagaceae bacterium]
MVTLRCFILLLLLTLFSCDLEKDITINLPPYEAQPIVECYIESGKPYRLALYETVDYFGSPQITLLANALVVITHNGISDTLKYQTIPDTLGGKFYNYVGDTSKHVVDDFVNNYQLYVKDSKGRELYSSTKQVKRPTLDSVWFVFNNQNRATTTIRFNDVDIFNKNFYRYLIIVDIENFIEKGDIIFSDELVTGNTIQVTSRSTVEPGFININLTHLTPEHYYFLKSVEDANNANGNPFAQPSSIRSNITGGIGIFTCLSSDREVVLVPTP